MKMKCAFEAVDMGSEVIAVPVGNGADQVHGVLKLNKTGLEIIQILEKDTTIEEIISQLTSKYDNNEDTIAEYVRDIVELLRSNNLIEE
ncbi:PqqD family protein [Aristaeella hokkaidonensis]|uniref:PqqD family protein n=1 Tax=Aristaeella hokkaidonensis TaxID=3046382 RepID=A0AC61MYJ0_9FIRM|nr:PqqD family protein [Aristaeella hokkaidonensis]QUC68199.1 PqqD family protein [Aristaeella hokkaidonensis]SNT95241.1 Coenzyme PQQ synthesis protein D (PqqD) [Aristaeella hokkaidonensis]